MNHIVFDLGAVLVTWQPQELIRRHLPARFHERDVAQLARELFHHPDWQAFDRGDASLHDTAHAIATRTGIEPDAVLRMIDENGVPERLRPMAPTVAVLDALRRRRESRGDVRLYYLSNMPAPYARQLERHNDFLGWFDGGVFSGDVRLAKPDARIYQHLAERHALPPAATLFIDDHLPNVAAARALGWQAHHFEHAEGLRERLGPLLQA